MAEDQEDRPWTEQQWDDFMRNADLRAARYGELMETLIDDPDREEIIDHEMGWDRKRGAIDEQWLQEVTEAAAEAQEELENSNEASVDDPVDVQQMDDVDQHRDRELDAIPAYAACEAASNAIDRALVPLMRDAHEEADEDVAQAYIQIKIAGAKIAGGHGMGYKDEVLGGNVVNCKRALAAVEECQIALKLVEKKRLIPATALPLLLEYVARSHKAISDRIAELRARMWWQK
jgi:hypothetical protein